MTTTPTAANKLAAARGQAGLPPEAALELLVALSRDADQEVRSEARRTLAAWPTETLQPLLTRRSTTAEVLEYQLVPENLRRELLPPILANPDAPQQAAAELAAVADLDTVKVLLENIDLLRTPVLVALKNNTAYLKMHESRLTAQTEGFVFEPSFLELLIAEAQLEEERQAVKPLAEEEIQKLDKQIAEAEAKGDEETKVRSVYAKIAAMTVSQKVSLCMKGNKDERAILIRDPSKLIARAVLGSPKISDQEIETFASLKSVTDEVLRLIAVNRKFMKNYTVLKNLAFNPRTPLDIGLTLLNRLLPQEQKAMAMDRNVSETMRKMAVRLSKPKEK
jgi:hypothetical protein